MAINEKFQAHLMTDPGSGGSIQRTGCGREDYLVIRKLTDGTITLARTLNNFNYDKVFIGNASSFALYCLGQFGTGPLTAVYIELEFSINGVNFYPQAYMIYTGGITTLHQHKYHINDNGVGQILTVNNPGSNWVRFYTSAVGVITASNGYIAIAHNWSSGHPMGFK